MIAATDLELLPPGDFVSDHIRATGAWFELDILEHLATLPLTGTIVDAGAHIGNHAVFLADRFPGCHVLAFEPILETFAVLGRNSKLIRHGMSALPTALSGSPDTLRMVVDANAGHSRVDADGGRQVPAIALDQVMLRDVSLLKLDVEYHEAQVLAGAAATIERCRPVIVAEDWSSSLEELLRRSFGYAMELSWPDHQTALYRPAR